MTIFQFFDQLNTRWKSESPAFFIWLRNFGLRVATVGASMMAPNMIPKVILPSWISTAGSYMIVAGAVIGFISQLTCKNTPSSPNS